MLHPFAPGSGFAAMGGDRHQRTVRFSAEEATVVGVAAAAAGSVDFSLLSSPPPPLLPPPAHPLHADGAWVSSTCKLRRFEAGSECSVATSASLGSSGHGSTSGFDAFVLPSRECDASETDEEILLNLLDDDLAEPAFLASPQLSAQAAPPAASSSLLPFPALTQLPMQSPSLMPVAPRPVFLDHVVDGAEELATPRASVAKAEPSAPIRPAATSTPTRKRNRRALEAHATGTKQEKPSASAGPKRTKSSSSSSNNNKNSNSNNDQSTAAKRRKSFDAEDVLIGPNGKRVVGNRELTSRFRGVCWYKRTNKWVVQIKIDGKRKHIGYYTSEEEAGAAYDNALRDLVLAQRARARELGPKSAMMRKPRRRHFNRRPADL